MDTIDPPHHILHIHYMSIFRKLRKNLLNCLKKLRIKFTSKPAIFEFVEELRHDEGGGSGLVAPVHVRIRITQRAKRMCFIFASYTDIRKFWVYPSGVNELVEKELTSSGVHMTAVEVTRQNHWSIVNGTLK